MFYFDVENSAFAETLDVFGQFFLAPLLNPKYVDKELHAVDSEFRKNLNNDFWRERNLFKSRSNPEAPYRKFITGNLDSLQVPNIYERLRAFYDSNYR